MRDEGAQLGDAFALLLEANRRAVRTAVVARVESYDPATQTASVLPLVQETRTVDGAEVAVPSYQLDEVPVVWPAGGSRGLTMGLDRGAMGLLTFRHRSHDEIDSGTEGPLVPASHRRMSLSDVVLLAGYTVPGSQDSGRYADGGAMVIHFPSGEAVLVGDSTAAEALALASKCDARLSTIQSAHDGHTHNVTWTGTAGTGPSTAPLAPIGSLASVACDDVKVRS